MVSKVPSDQSTQLELSTWDFFLVRKSIVLIQSILEEKPEKNIFPWKQQDFHIHWKGFAAGMGFIIFRYNICNLPMAKSIDHEDHNGHGSEAECEDQGIVEMEYHIYREM